MQQKNLRSVKLTSKVHFNAEISLNPRMSMPSQLTSLQLALLGHTDYSLTVLR